MTIKQYIATSWTNQLRKFKPHTKTREKRIFLNKWQRFEKKKVPIDLSEKSNNYYTAKHYIGLNRPPFKYTLTSLARVRRGKNVHSISGFEANVGCSWKTILLYKVTTMTAMLPDHKYGRKVPWIGQLVPLTLLLLTSFFGGLSMKTFFKTPSASLTQLKRRRKSTIWNILTDLLQNVWQNI